MRLACAGSRNAKIGASDGCRLQPHIPVRDAFYDAVMEVEIGRGKKARRAYGFDDIAIVPSRRTRDPDDVDISWTLGPYRFDLPLLAAASSGRSKRYGPSVQEMSTSSGSRVRRDGTIAMSSNPYALLAFLPRPISTSITA